MKGRSEPTPGTNWLRYSSSGLRIRCVVKSWVFHEFQLLAKSGWLKGVLYGAIHRYLSGARGRRQWQVAPNQARRGAGGGAGREGGDSSAAGLDAFTLGQLLGVLRIDVGVVDVGRAEELLQDRAHHADGLLEKLEELPDKGRRRPPALLSRRRGLDAIERRLQPVQELRHAVDGCARRWPA